jgi:hypothetical protein
MKHVTLYNQTITGRPANILLHEKDVAQDKVAFTDLKGPAQIGSTVTIKGCQNEGLIVEIQALRAKLVGAGVL